MLTRIGGLIISLQISRRPVMCVMIIWPTLQFSVSSCTTINRPVRRTDSSTASQSHGAIERRSINSTLASTPICSRASNDFSIVFPHATSVMSEPVLRVRALPSGTARIGSVYSCSAQSKCFGISTNVGSSQCIAVQRRPAASSGVLGITMLMPG